MEFTKSLLKGKLIKRYKRFFVDIKLNKSTVTAHCPNTGSMKGLLEEGNDVFVAVNHWPRAWARRISENPNVQITYNEATLSYNAVILEGGEHDKAVLDFPVPLAFRILTGFPPRYFFRFELQEDAV